MTASLKPRSEVVASAELFGKLGKLFNGAKAPSTLSVAAELEKSRTKLHRHVSLDELEVLRNTVRSLALLIDNIEPDASASKNDADKFALTQAQREDEMAARVLRKLPSSKAMSTPQSVRAGNALIAQARTSSQETMVSRIARGEFLTSGELQRLLGIKRASVSGAVKAQRMFAVVGPSGENYYPAYFADEGLDRRALEKVSKLLGPLPASSKHHFFTSKSTLLGSTPLEALHKGQLAEVLTAAAAFVER